MSRRPPKQESSPEQLRAVAVEALKSAMSFHSDLVSPDMAAMRSAAASLLRIADSLEVLVERAERGSKP